MSIRLNRGELLPKNVTVSVPHIENKKTNPKGLAIKTDYFLLYCVFLAFLHL